MPNNNSKNATGLRSVLPVDVADLANQWRKAVQAWLKIEAQQDWGAPDSERWQKCESRYWACSDRLVQTSKKLAVHLATQGVGVFPMTELLKVCDSNADVWLEDDDGGEARRLHAIAATEKLLRIIEAATSDQQVASKPSGRTSVDHRQATSPRASDAKSPPPTELNPANGTPTSPSRPKFPRRAEARQQCLLVLADAPNGIPTHEDIARATGLDHQTVKEAMPKLRKAHHVEKREGAWFITESGRNHLNLLRGV